jgi:hypothetical protein
MGSPRRAAPDRHAPPEARGLQPVRPLDPDLLRRVDANWRANYLSVGQIYLQDNPLLETPLRRERIKPRLPGHWRTTAGLNFLYVHLNRLAKLSPGLCVIDQRLAAAEQEHPRRAARRRRVLPPFKCAFEIGGDGADKPP